MMSTSPTASNYQLLTSTRYDPFLKTLSWNNDNDHADPSAFFLLPLHFARLVSAARAHGWSNGNSEWLKYDVLKAACLDAVWEQQSELGKEERSTAAFRVRITVSRGGQILATATRLPTPFTSDPTLASLFKPISPPNSSDEDIIDAGPTQQLFEDERPPLTIYIDNEATTSSIFTQTKTTFRDTYDQAKSRTSAQHTSTADLDVLLYNTSDADGEIMETSIFNVAFYRSSTWLTPSTRTGCLPGVMRRWLLDNGSIAEDHEGRLTKSSVVADEWVLVFNGVQGCRLGKVYV